MAGKTVEKDAATKVARQRLSVLEMSEALGEHLGGMPSRRDGSDEFL